MRRGPLEIRVEYKVVRIRLNRRVRLLSGVLIVKTWPRLASTLMGFQPSEAIICHDVAFTNIMERLGRSDDDVPSGQVGTLCAAKKFPRLFFYLVLWDS